MSITSGQGHDGALRCALVLYVDICAGFPLVEPTSTLLRLPCTTTRDNTSQRSHCQTLMSDAHAKRGEALGILTCEGIGGGAK